MTGSLELDAPGTWPRWLREDLLARATRPDDEGGAALVRRLGAHPLRLYHATRLTPGERAAVRARGLAPAGSSLVRDKVAAAVADGALAPRAARRLVAEHLADDPARSGLVWFCPWRAPVQDPDPRRLWIFFRHWGGQALWLAEDRAGRHDVLAVGRPVLVVAGVPADRASVVAPPDAPRPGPWDGVPPGSRLAVALWEALHRPDPAPFLVTTAAAVPAARVEAMRVADGPLPTGDPLRWSEEPAPPARRSRGRAAVRIARWSLDPGLRRPRARSGCPDGCGAP